MTYENGVFLPSWDRYDTSTSAGSWPTQTITTVGSVTLWPTACAGNVHVWSCEHTVACRCGKATRTRPVCAVCGTA